MKQSSHSLADAIAQGYRYYSANKPPLRPGVTVRLRNGGENTIVRLDSEEDVAMLMATTQEEPKDAA